MKRSALFLDFDGVLNSSRTRRATKDGWKKLDPGMVGLVNYVVAETGCDVVVSSSWRTGKTAAGLTEILRDHGAGFEVFDKTPRNRGLERGWEIEEWLEKTGRASEPFAIVDDGSDMAHLRCRLVQTCDLWGLTDAGARASIELLRRPRERDELTVCEEWRRSLLERMPADALENWAR